MGKNLMYAISGNYHKAVELLTNCGKHLVNVPQHLKYNGDVAECLYANEIKNRIREILRYMASDDELIILSFVLNELLGTTQGNDFIAFTYY